MQCCVFITSSTAEDTERHVAGMVQTEEAKVDPHPMSCDRAQQHQWKRRLNEGVQEASIGQKAAGVSSMATCIDTRLKERAPRQTSIGHEGSKCVM